ncbi:hypothetical protein FACS1894187_23880 [Synergistales bacterium]|nr:hypothetical protein FACS1894187_23880 [Synergistales bacterium]
MKKLKLYLDTSVISHLRHEDVPEKMKDTLLFWEELKTGKHEVVISEFTLDELRQCPEPKQTELFNCLGDIEYVLLKENHEVKALTETYLEEGVLSRKNRGDCLHMAFATVNGCDMIASWNFKHMVRVKVIQGIRIVNAKKGYFKLIDIIQPTMMTQGEETNESAGN